MLLSDPAPTPYDWHFRLMGFEVRVTWLFWVMAAALGYEWAYQLDQIYDRWLQLPTPGLMVLLAIWVAGVLVSILVHELGHSLAFRLFGVSSHIVLYHFGGLAIPSGYGGSAPSRLKPAQQIIISAAGPLLQMSLAIFVGAIAIGLGLDLGSTGRWLQSLGVGLPQSELPGSAAQAALIDALIYPSFFWSLLNLLPILPLDGGRIVQHACSWWGGADGLYVASMVSVVAAGLGCYMALFHFQQQYLGLMLLLLGISSFQTLQQWGGYGRGW